jgi:hypothetical protein
MRAIGSIDGIGWVGQFATARDQQKSPVVLSSVSTLTGFGANGPLASAHGDRAA